MEHSARAESSNRAAGSEARRPAALGLGSATALVVGHTIGVGIFLTPAQLIGALASPAWTLGMWATCGGLALAGALAFGELAARHPESGGTYVYLREAWGGRAAFLYGWQSLLVMDPGITAALAVGLSQYVVLLWPAAAGRERAVGLAAIWLLALLDMAGLRFRTRTFNALASAKVLALLAIVVAAFAIGSGSWSHFEPFATRRPGAPPLREALGLGLIGAFYSFGGFWEASRVAGEVRDARRVLPRALAIGVALVTAIYLATTAAFIYLVPIDQTRDPAVFAQRAGEALLGPRGPSAFAWVVVLSVSASAMALLLMAPRVYLAMSRDGLFPKWLAAVSPRTQAPVRATALLAALASVFVLSGNFSQILALFMAPTLVFIALTSAGLFVLRRREPDSRGFRAPGYPATPALFALLILGVVASIALARPLQALAGFAIVLLGIPAHRILSFRGALDSRQGGGR